MQIIFGILLSLLLVIAGLILIYKRSNRRNEPETEIKIFRQSIRTRTIGIPIVFLGVVIASFVLFNRPDKTSSQNPTPGNTTPIKPQTASATKDSLVPATASILVHLVDSDAENRKKIPNVIVRILKPIEDPLKLKLRPKFLSDDYSDNITKEMVGEKPDLVIIHLHAYGANDSGSNTKLGKLLVSYYYANPNVQFIVYSRAFSGNNGEDWKQKDATSDSLVRKRIATILLPNRNEIKNSNEQALRDLVNKKIKP